ncbi:hypothetical protein B0H34DRAFT_736433 [Crassisporium funariophilum]|nr:hypothetical protein B0H34DRAFT_736433 [Crassisporium funariophilum]
MHKREIGWDLVVINPPLVLGPTLQKPADPQSLTSSLHQWYNKKPNTVLCVSYCYIDMCDLVLAHVLALAKEEAGGERIIVAAGATTWQESCNFVILQFQHLFLSGFLPRGNIRIKKEILFEYNTAKSKRILNMEFKSFEEITRDLVLGMEGRGWMN